MNSELTLSQLTVLVRGPGQCSDGLTGVFETLAYVAHGFFESTRPSSCAVKDGCLLLNVG